MISANPNGSGAQRAPIDFHRVGQRFKDQLANGWIDHASRSPGKSCKMSAGEYTNAAMLSKGIAPLSLKLHANRLRDESAIKRISESTGLVNSLIRCASQIL